MIADDTRSRRIRLLTQAARIVSVILIVGFGAASSAAAGACGSGKLQPIPLFSSKQPAGSRTGFAVALSGDGQTALVGSVGANHDHGVVRVFIRHRGEWIEQTQLEVPGSFLFGEAVALSRTGDTALVGSASNDGGIGAAWVFTRSGTTWREQATLRPKDELGQAYFGDPVALTDNGRYAFVSGPDDDPSAAGQFGQGAVWVFQRYGTTWRQDGKKLVAPSETRYAAFGGSIALTGNGNEAVIGAPADDNKRGAAWFFGRKDDIWRPIGREIIPSGEIGAGEFGYAVAISANGAKALISGIEDDRPNIKVGGRGAVWTYTDRDGVWRQQGKLTSPRPASGDGYGDAISISANGEIAIVGSFRGDQIRGNVWILTATPSGWTVHTSPLLAPTVAGPLQDFGLAIALAATGDTALIGAPRTAGLRGAAWIYTLPSTCWK